MIATSSFYVARRRFIGVLAAVAFTSPQAAFAQANPLLGTWQLNLTKSTFRPGPGPRSQPWTIVATGQGVTLNLEGIGAQGATQKSVWPIIFDGRPHPVTGNVNADAVTSRRIDPYTLQGEYLKVGSTVGNWTMVVSRDSRITTFISTARLVNGQQNNNVAIFDRQ
jgi:hypothetical protein